MEQQQADRMQQGTGLQDLHSVQPFEHWQNLIDKN